MYIVDMFSAKINERESSLCLIFTLSSEWAIIMTKLLDGYYRGLNSFYEIVKVSPNEVNDCQLLFSSTLNLHITTTYAQGGKRGCLWNLQFRKKMSTDC